jgi:hypothetical protein
VAVARYHITPTGPKLCSASIRSCPYGGAENHFESDRIAREKFRELPKTPAQLFRDNQPIAKTLTIGDTPEETSAVVYSANWGAAISDLIDKHIDETSTKPEQIQFLFYWEEPSLNGDPRYARNYLFEAAPRLDDSLGKFTNIYRMAWWNPNDKLADDAIKFVYAKESGRDARWDRVPKHMKWEAAFGEGIPEIDPTRNSAPAKMRARDERMDKNKMEFREVLNRANILNLDELANKLRDPSQTTMASLQDSSITEKRPVETTALYNYERSLERKAANVFDAIKATENTLIGPYDAYDRGIGFYNLDNDRRTVVEEELGSTFVRGRHLQQLGLDSRKWLTGSWKGDEDRYGNSLGNQAKFERVANSVDKGIPYQSPMTFWTANTPDGARWELGLDVSSPETGSNRVRYFDATNPSIPARSTTPGDPFEGFATMKGQMEERYGDSARWSPRLQRDMRILADLVEGHRVMTISGKASRDRMKEYGFDKPKAVQTAKEEHSSLFGSLGKLFG